MRVSDSHSVTALLIQSAPLHAKKQTVQFARFLRKHERMGPLINKAAFPSKPCSERVWFQIKGSESCFNGVVARFVYHTLFARPVKTSGQFHSRGKMRAHHVVVIIQCRFTERVNAVWVIKRFGNLGGSHGHQKSNDSLNNVSALFAKFVGLSVFLDFAYRRPLQTDQRPRQSLQFQIPFV